eukprot:COSAG02_NODE_47453_length_341_cov_0.623967_1_plen_80_part_10
MQNQIAACDMDPECDEDPLIPLLSGACLGCLVANDGGDGLPPIEPCLSDGAMPPPPPPYVEIEVAIVQYTAEEATAASAE